MIAPSQTDSVSCILMLSSETEVPCLIPLFSSTSSSITEILTWLIHSHRDDADIILTHSKKMIFVYV